MITEKQERDTRTFRILEVEIDDAYRDVVNAESLITSGLDMDNYDECYSAVATIMNAIETIRTTRKVIDQLDIDWETL